MADDNKFGSKLGLIAATAGSAVGLGNVWRFPAVAYDNGGGAFLLIYLVFVFILGIPVMLSEFALGRGGNTDSIGAYRKLTPNTKWYLNGILSVVTPYIILGFYLVVTGWMVKYFVLSLSGDLYAVPDGVQPSEWFSECMGESIQDTWTPLFYTWTVIFINLFVLLNGIKKGIEKVSNILMPMLFLILVLFCGIALTLPGANEGVRYFLEPDFSAVTSKTLISAAGQAFFSLSLGMGILVTYSAYYPKDTRLSRTALITSSFDFFVALMMGLIIFPTVTAFGLQDSNLAGPALVFTTLPEVFMQMHLTRFWSTLFFLLLSVAAITSTISLAEVTVSVLQHRLRLRRRKAVWVAMLPLLALATIFSLSNGVWSNITIFGYNFFDAADKFTSNVMLPICAFLGCIYVGWKLPKTFLENQLTNFGTFRSYIYPVVLLLIRYVAPILILIIMLSPLFI